MQGANLYLDFSPAFYLEASVTAGARGRLRPICGNISADNFLRGERTRELSGLGLEKSIPPVVRSASVKSQYFLGGETIWLAQETIGQIPVSAAHPLKNLDSFQGHLSYHGLI